MEKSVKFSLPRFLKIGSARSANTTGNNPVVSTTVDMLPGGVSGVRLNGFQREHSVRSFSSWVYIAAMLNANAFSTVPLRMYVRKRAANTFKRRHFNSRSVVPRKKNYLLGDRYDRKEHPSKYVMQKIADFGDDFEEVTTPHPALQLLSKVNPWQNGFELSTLRLLYLQITGNAYIHPVIGPMGTPVELWPMPSQWVSVIPDVNTLIGGYTYGPPQFAVDFDINEVIRWALPNINDPYYGMSRVQGVWSGIQLSNRKRELDTALMANSGRPDWMLLAKTGATPENLDRLEAEVDQKLRGTKNGGRFIVAGGDVQAVKLNFSPDELGDQDSIVEEIAAGFGVPISKLKASDPNRAGAEVADTAWMRDGILPFLRQDEETLNANYLSLWGIQDDAVLAYDNPVPVNQKDEAERLSVLVKADIYYPNDARQELGLPTTQWGDKPFSQSTTVDPVADAINGQNPPAPAADGTDRTAGLDTAAQNTLLNGTQIAAALQIVTSVAAGEIPLDSGHGLLQQLFGLTAEQANLMLGSAGTKTPTIANPNPAAQAAQQHAETIAQANATTDPAAKPPQLDGSSPAQKRLPAPASTTFINNTPTGLARGLPGGEKLIPILLSMFRAQRKAVLSKFKGKSLDDIEQEFSAAVRSTHPGHALSGDLKGAALHAIRRAVWKAEMNRLAREQIAARHKNRQQHRKPGDDTPPEPPPVPLPTSFVSLASFTADLVENCRPVIEAIAKDEGTALLTTLGVTPATFSVFERNIPTAAQQLTLKFCEATNVTTSMQLDTALSTLRDEVSAGLVEGDTYAELTKRVEAVFDNAEQYRAERIARTEGTRASHAGELLSAKISRVVSRKKWLLSEDACPVCVEIASQGAIGLDKTFAEFCGEYGSIDGPPAHPNCVCSLTYEITDEPETEPSDGQGDGEE